MAAVHPIRPEVDENSQAPAPQAEQTPTGPPAIPSEGRDGAELLAEMQEMRHDDASFKDGRTWSLVYYAGDEYASFLKEAHNLFFSENALNPMAFKSLKRMEAEVVRMTASMLHGDEKAVGTMTSGGTESLLLAVKTYRDWAKRNKPWIRNPEMVLPRTAHPAFEKAAHYFGVKARFAPVRGDYRADVREMKKRINRNTILIVGSAPQYPHGVVDPIEELAAIGLKKNIPVHVDGCIGGFMLPWIEKLGHAVPRWDFRVPGVTSISADVHKYGYGAKGASTIVYRNMSYLKHQFFIATDFPGGIYLSPSIPGTRPGGTIAAAWAALNKMGESGYLEHTEKALEAKRALIDGIAKIDGVRVLGEPDGTLVTWGADDDDVDVYAVADELESRGWSVDRQQHPASCHLTVTSNHLPIIDQYLKDLEESVKHVLAHPELKAARCRTSPPSATTTTTTSCSASSPNTAIRPWARSTR
jgi:glutamate/tyrosine decarboxylase-like PLP-dependent enzyme